MKQGPGGSVCTAHNDNGHRDMLEATLAALPLADLTAAAVMFGMTEEEAATATVSEMAEMCAREWYE